MTFLVTGAAGFIGSYVVRALADRGEEVVGLDNLNDYYAPSLKLDRLKQLNLCSDFKFYYGDLTDYDFLTRLFRNHRFNKVCHLAAQAGVRYSLQNPFIYQKSNIEGFLNILELCKNFAVQNLVYASSSSVYGSNTKIPFSIEDNTDCPISLYAASKKANELMAFTYHHLYKLKCTGLRFFTVYGPWGRPDMAYFKFTRAITGGREIDVYNYGNMQRDFTYIKDIVNGVIAALDRDYDFEIFNLGNSKPITLDYLIKCIEENLRIKSRKKYLPMQTGDVEVTYADIDYSRDKLDFVPATSIEEGIAEFVQWYMRYYRIIGTD